MTTVRIAIADPHPLVRDALRRLFADHGRIQVTAEAATSAELAAKARRIDLMLIELTLPLPVGIDTVARIRASTPAIGILVFTSYPAEHCAIALLRAGASGYLNKCCEPETIVEAVRTVSSGGRYFSPRVTQLLASQLTRGGPVDAHERLSAREFDVFCKLAKGQTLHGVAEALALSVKTVSTYRSRLLEKMNLASNSDLTCYALNNKLIR